MHLEWLEANIRTVFPKEVHQCLLILLFDDCLNEILKPYHDPLIRSGKGLLVINSDFEIFYAARNLEEFEVSLGHIDVERSPRISVLLRVPLLQKFFVHLDGHFPILSSDSSISPFE